MTIITADKAIRDSGLPIVEVLDQLCAVLSEGDELVLEAPPGAGKTTLVPLALLNQPWLEGQKILVLEPRRLAARAAAERMASLLGERAGETVGYRMRLDTRVGKTTRIEVITEGILNRMLQSDPALAGVGLLVFDEFHERNLDSDLGLALSLQGRELYREPDDPLKLLLMSATLDGEAVAQLLGGAPRLRSEGRRYPVTVHYDSALVAGQRIEPVVTGLLSKLLRQSSTDSILVFLPGQGEITRIADALSVEVEGLPVTLRATIDIAPLYGSLPFDQQRRAIEPASAGRRKVVLATNIAETSLTIEGVSIVVDSGLLRAPVFDPGTGMTRLETRRISKASSVQRAGRAGRLGPGHCYRLWSEAQQQQLAEQATPEIQQADLAPLALQLLAWGVDDPAELLWLDPPPRGPFNQALQLLKDFGALEKSAGGRWQLSAHGERMAARPVHPRLAHLLLVGAEQGLQQMACQLAAILSERAPGGNRDADLWLLWSILDGGAGCPATLRSWRQRVLRQARQFNQRYPSSEMSGSELLRPDQAVGFLVASAYPDRIAKRRSGNVYQLSNGRSACLEESDPLITSDWLAVAELGGRVGRAEDRIYSAVTLDSALFESRLAGVVSWQERVEWDDKAGRVVAEACQRVGALQLASRKLPQIPVESRRGAITAMLHRRGIDVLPWTGQLRQWQARVSLLHHLASGQDDNPWPDVSDQALLDSVEQWLLPWLDKVGSLEQLRKLDLGSLLGNLLPWPLPRQLDQLAPPRITVPSGSSIEIDYCHSPPVLAVKLQEMFGCEQTPSVAGGRVALLVHLLSPARRPLQVTQDLSGFWRNSYQQVKKDMKGRYPKHPWPDDPLQAQATRHTKNRQR